LRIALRAQRRIKDGDDLIRRRWSGDAAEQCAA